MANDFLYDFSGLKSVFSNKNYSIYAVGNCISLIGLWVQRLAVGWLTWELTKSGFWLGVIAFADLFPVVIFGLFGGVIADKYNRKLILLFGQSLSFCQAILLWILTSFGLIEIWSLFFLALFQGLVVASIQSARLSLIPSLVQKEDIGGAVAISAVIFNIARFIGPGIAGIIIALFGIATAFAFNAVTFLSLIIALLLINIRPQLSELTNEGNIFNSVKNGIYYSFKHPAISPLLLLMAFASILARPVMELLPAFSDSIFYMGSNALALLTSSAGLGALVAGLWLAQRRSPTGLSLISLNSAFFAGVGVLMFSVTNIIWVASFSLVIVGFCVASLGISTQILIQSGVEDNMRGRVLSIWGLLLRGLPAIGALVMGWSSDFVGLRAPVIISIILYLFLVILLMKRRNLIASLE